MSWADNQKGIEVLRAYNSVDMGVDQDQSRACTPMAQEARLDMRFVKRLRQQSIGSQVNHSYKQVLVDIRMDGAARTCSNILRSAGELLQGM
jgi:hypothetical protein